MPATARDTIHVKNDKVATFLRHFIMLFVVCLFYGFSPVLEAWTPLPGITISPTTGVSVNNPQIGMDAAGNATAIWQEFNISTNLTTVSFATLPRGASMWSSPGVISSPEVGLDNAVNPQIAVTPSGYSVAVWEENGTVQSATRAVFGGAWSSSLTVSAPTTDPSNLVPHVAVDPNGNAVAIWSWFNGSHYIIQAATLPFNTSSWINLTNLSDPTKDSLMPVIALDAAGNGVAVFNQITDGLIQSRTYSGGTWLATTNTLGSSPFEEQALAMNPSGVAVAVWVANEEVINASRYIGGVWSSPTTISLPGPSSYPAVAIDIFGNALALWVQPVGGSAAVTSAYLPIGSNVWLSPIFVSSPSPTGLVLPEVAFDAQGNSTAIWVLQQAPNPTIQAAQLPFGTNLWINQTTLSAANENSTIPQIAVDPSGYAVVDWQSSIPSETTVIQATTNPAPPLPPSNFIGIVKKNKFLNKTECLLRATWEASISNVSSYLIYKNGVVVNTVLAMDPFTFNICLLHCSTEGYEIAAMGLDGLVSNPVQLRIINEKACKPCH